jgi:hypothetical protein
MLWFLTFLVLAGILESATENVACKKTLYFLALLRYNQACEDDKAKDLALMKYQEDII